MARTMEEMLRDAPNLPARYGVCGGAAHSTKRFLRGGLCRECRVARGLHPIRNEKAD